MKTIEITDEMYAELMHISEQMNKQNHLHTRMPYLVQVCTDEEVAAHEGSGEEIWYDGEGSVLHTESGENEIFECIKQCLIDEEDFEEDAAEEKADDICSEGDFDTFLEDRGWTHSQIEDKTIYKNGFLTKEAALKHIEENKHHYNNPRTCIVGLFRNPEMETVAKFLCELSGGKIHR